MTVSAATPAGSTLAPGGSRTFTYTLSGAPSGSGTLTATWNYLGMTCFKQVEIFPPVPNICNPSNPTLVVDVISPITGRIWMDRNLGANQAATSATDAQSYGHLFQWGRGADGHQYVNRYAGDGVTTSGTTTTLSSTDSPGHGDFITANFGSANGNNWRSTTNNNLWQGVNGTNNPCPSGYRLPSDGNFQLENLLGGVTGFANSVLRLPRTGSRENDGSLTFAAGTTYYWTSTIINNQARVLRITEGSYQFTTRGEVYGLAVRCIKN